MRVVHVDPSSCEFEETDLRQAVDHMNVLRFLEASPCHGCLAVTAVQPGAPGTLLVDLAITHPYVDPLFTAFDVRVIFMFNGSHMFPATGYLVADSLLGDAGLANADGYTTLYNPFTAGYGLQGWQDGEFATQALPNCRLNPFIRVFTDDPSNTRNAFLTGESLTLTCAFDKPDGPFVFAYAVDACWAPPLSRPVQDPIADFGPDANCPEAWRIDVSEAPIGDGLSDFGGQTLLTIDVYDWQGPDSKHPPTVECPDLFTGALVAEWVGDFDGFSRYEATIANSRLAQSGYYPCLIRKEAKENDPSTPYMDLSSYQLYYVRVNHPFNPVDITPEALNLNAVDSVVNGNYAYVSSGDTGLKIYDISDPSSPLLLTAIHHDGTFGDIDYKDGYVYACLTYDLVAVIDVDPPESAAIVRIVDLDKHPTAISAGDGYVYVAGYYDYVEWAYLETLDVSNPQEAYRVSSVRLQAAAWVVHSDGTTVYTFSSGYLQIWDASDPENVTQISKLKIPKTSDLGNRPRQLVLSNGYAYIASSGAGLLVIDVSSPKNPQLDCEIDVDNACGVAVLHDRLYFTDSWRLTGALHVADITDPDAPQMLHTYPGYGGLIDVSDGRAYFSAYDFAIADITQPDSVTTLGWIGSPYYIDRITLHNGYCFATTIFGELKIIDVDPVQSSRVVGTVDGMETARTIDVQGDLAFVAMWSHGYAVVDVGHPESPEVIAKVDIPGGVYDLDVDGHYAYVGSGSELRILDIASLASPKEIAGVQITCCIRSLEYRSGLVYLTIGKGALAIIDVSDPYFPFQVAEVPLPGEASYIATDGEFAVVACENRLAFVDVNPPEDAHLVTSYKQKDVGDMGVALSHGYAVVPESPALIFDARPPWMGELVHSFYAGGRWEDVAVRGNIVYVSDRNGLFITRLW